MCATAYESSELEFIHTGRSYCKKVIEEHTELLPPHPDYQIKDDLINMKNTSRFPLTVQHYIAQETLSTQAVAAGRLGKALALGGRHAVVSLL